LHVIGVQRKEIYSVIFEIKWIQFSPLNALLSTKPIIIRFGSCPNIALAMDSPTMPTMYHEGFNFDFRKEIFDGILLSILTCASNTLGLIFAFLTSKLASRIRIFDHYF